MGTVFSHIVQKRLSQENENVATEALAFIVDSSAAARRGLMKVLLGVAPELPALRFRTQQTENDARPDMWGYDAANLRVLIENKFWAGLTENQPVQYMRLLEKCSKPAVLLVVVPTAREETVWRELQRRLNSSKILVANRDTGAGIVHAADTEAGTILALTSWPRLLSAIEVELLDEPQSRNDLQQLRALCEAADSDAFVPISSTELTDQRTAAFILQLGATVKRAVDLSITEGVLSIDRLRQAPGWERIGRYVSFPMGSGFGCWFGIDFRLWRQYGCTPLWLVFSRTAFGRAPEVQAILEPWADNAAILTKFDDDRYVIGIDLLTGEDFDAVVRSVADQLKVIANELAVLGPK